MSVRLPEVAGPGLDVSIVVPFHNEETHIERSIQALLALDYPRDRYEVIFVNNNSSDRSVEIVERYPDVRLFHESVVGDFAARNRGVMNSRGAIIAFTDSDTAPFPDWIRKMTEGLRDPDVQLLLGNLRFAPGSRLLGLLAAYEHEKNEFIFSGDEKEIYYGYTCNLVVRRSVFETHGLFPPVFRNADVVLVRRVVDEYGCAAARYASDVSVRRLEVASVRDYVTKQHVYGRDFARYGGIANARPLNNAERLRVFRRTVRSQGYSLPGAALLFGLLAVGAISYELGRWRGT